MMCVKLLYQTRIGSQAETSTASSNGILSVSVGCRSSRPDLFQRAAVTPPFICRCFSMAENLVESASQDSSACVSDVAPRIKFKRLDKTAKHIMQACILILDIGIIGD
jgi:large subunit ribosomal protein L19